MGGEAHVFSSERIKGGVGGLRRSNTEAGSKGEEGIEQRLIYVTSIYGFGCGSVADNSFFYTSN